MRLVGAQKIQSRSARNHRPLSHKLLPSTSVILEADLLSKDSGKEAGDRGREIAPGFCQQVHGQADALPHPYMIALYWGSSTWQARLVANYPDPLHCSVTAEETRGGHTQRHLRAGWLHGCCPSLLKTHATSLAANKRHPGPTSCPLPSLPRGHPRRGLHSMPSDWTGGEASRH
jgi:hypothetical protein